METKFVYFDYGNVICTDPDTAFFQYFAERLSKPFEEVRTAFAEEFGPMMVGRMTEQEFWEIMVEKLNMPGEVSDLNGLFAQFYSPSLKPKPEILEAVEKVKASGIGVGILSNIITPLMQICQEQGYYRGFNPVVVSANVQAKKPSPQIYRIALKFIPIKRKEAGKVVFVDDKQKNLNAAADLGFRTVHFNNEFESASDLEIKLREAGVEY